MKKKIIILSLIGITIASADYIKGVKYYNRYIKNKSGLKSTTLIKELNVTNPLQLNYIFDNNRTILFKTLKDNNNSKAIKGLERILKSKRKTKDVKDFLDGILDGKLPASCS